MHTDTPTHTDTRPGQIHMLMYLGNGCDGNNFNIAMVINLQVKSIKNGLENAQVIWAYMYTVF